MKIIVDEWRGNDEGSEKTSINIRLYKVIGFLAVKIDTYNRTWDIFRE
jgi:hypothetical protein